MFPVLVKENVHSFRAATVGTANPREISCCVTSFQISRNSVALFESLNSQLNGLMLHSKFERFSTVDTPLLNTRSVRTKGQLSCHISIPTSTDVSKKVTNLYTVGHLSGIQQLSKVASTFSDGECQIIFRRVDL